MEFGMCLWHVRTDLNVAYFYILVHHHSMIQSLCKLSVLSQPCWSQGYSCKLLQNQV